MCLALLSLTLAWGAPARGQTPAGGDAAAVRAALEAIAAGRGDLRPLVVTYDDLHPLWGGLRLTIRGTGRVEQTAVRVPAAESRRVPRQDLVRLAALLVRHAVWEQRVSERVAAPDESRTSLTVEYRQATVRIWEWHNDLGTNRRIGEIGDFMKGIARKGPGARAPLRAPSLASGGLDPRSPTAQPVVAALSRRSGSRSGSRTAAPARRGTPGPRRGARR